MPEVSKLLNIIMLICLLIFSLLIVIFVFYSANNLTKKIKKSKINIRKNENVMKVDIPKKVKFLENILFIESFVFLVPTTILYITGLCVSIYLYFYGNKGMLTPFFLIVSGFLLIPGYGLFSIWWIISKFKYISIRTVPRYIWLGVVLGGLNALIFVYPIISASLSYPEKSRSIYNNMKLFIAYGGGPLIVLFTILLFFRIKNKI